MLNNKLLLVLGVPSIQQCIIGHHKLSLMREKIFEKDQNQNESSIYFKDVLNTNNSLNLLKNIQTILYLQYMIYQNAKDDIHNYNSYKYIKILLKTSISKESNKEWKIYILLTKIM